MLEVLMRVVGLMGLLILDVLCWGATTLSVVLAPIGPLGEMSAELIRGIVALWFGLFYVNLGCHVFQYSSVSPLRACYREILVRTACLLWYPLSTTVALLALGRCGVRVDSGGVFVVGFLVAWGLVSLTIHARVSLATASPIKEPPAPASTFGGHPLRRR